MDGVCVVLANFVSLRWYYPGQVVGVVDLKADLSARHNRAPPTNIFVTYSEGVNRCQAQCRKQIYFTDSGFHFQTFLRGYVCDPG